MKKSILCALFLWGLSAPSWALSDIDLTGEVDFNAAVWNLPTGERGRSAFGAPAVFLDFNVPLKDENLLFVSVEGSETQNGTQDRFELKTREVYLDLVSVFDDLKALRIGLIPQVWQQAYYEIWNYRFLGTIAWDMTEKWKYQNYSDLGVSYMSGLPADLGEWALNFTNGEGRDEAEAGPHKEVALFMRMTYWEPWTLSLAYTRGFYEAYGEGVGLKERVQALLTYQVRDEWMVGLEYLGAKDPADGIDTLQIADGVDVLSHSGESIRSEGGSVFSVFQLAPRLDFMIRYDQMNPVVGDSDKEMKVTMAALGMQLSEDIRTAIAIDRQEYGKNFAAGVRDRSKVQLAAQVLF